MPEILVTSRYRESTTDNSWTYCIVASDDSQSAIEVGLADLRARDMWRTGMNSRAESIDLLTRGLTESGPRAGWSENDPRYIEL